MSTNNNTATPRGLSIHTLLILSFVVVSLMPISILGFKIYDAAWGNAWREVREKHQSLAKNLAAPIQRYLDDRHVALSLVKKQLRNLPMGANKNQTHRILSDGLGGLNDFQALFLLTPDQTILDYASRYAVQEPSKIRLDIDDNDFFRRVIAAGRPLLSPVVINPLSGKTTLLVALPLGINSLQGDACFLVGELRLEVIEHMRSGIHFGRHGHSAIVDGLGHVVAHPNPAWMDDTIKDLSNLSIVKEMMAGDTGVTEFYSPFKKEDMVAGYTAIPGYGWGIMVPQPRIEVQEQVDKVLRAELIWAMAGLTIALVVGFSLARWITRPINRLAAAGRGLQENNYEYRLPRSRDFAPREIQQLGKAFGGAVKDLITSRHELDALNQSLQQRVDEATAELRMANAKLEQLAQQDHLTQLANRRHFEETMTSLASRRQGDPQTVCLLLLDIDRFKEINDRYGHAAGDAVLTQIAEILRLSLRHTDLAARYAGDEFVVMLRADLAAGRHRASQLRESIDTHPFVYDGKQLRATVSIGLVSCQINQDCCSVEDVLRQVDEAMYEAKHQGRNRIAEMPLTVVK
jgi:diguanylate cyclase (GGDEF)-like protein